MISGICICIKVNDRFALLSRVDQVVSISWRYGIPFHRNYNFYVPDNTFSLQSNHGIYIK